MSRGSHVYAQLQQEESMETGGGEGAVAGDDTDMVGESMSAEGDGHPEDTGGGQQSEDGAGGNCEAWLVIPIRALHAL